MEHSNVFITGGTGTIGQAIIQRSIQENWNGRITSYSRSELSRIVLKQKYPQVNFVGGDVRDLERLALAMLGHDVVIHTAAQKHVSIGEDEPSETIATNVLGTQNVLRAALEAGIKVIVNISTDKVCYPNNVYGMTKYLGEQLCKEYAPILAELGAKVVTCRFGNIFGSRGSVIDIWQEQIANGEMPTITNPDMTRFWIKPSQVVDTILFSLDKPNGSVVIPELPGLTMAKFAEYVLGENVPYKTIGMKPGEKLHEVLVTSEEFQSIAEFMHGGYYVKMMKYGDHEVNPPINHSKKDYTSFNARQMKKEELAD
jgi:UDP-N-acetylglucosamine 4,6-dehydratase/5-epimerase